MWVVNDGHETHFTALTQSCASVRESLSATPPPPTTEPKGEQDAAHEDDDSDADSRPRLTESSLNRSF